MKSYETIEEGRRLEVRLTMHGRLERGARRFGVTLPWTVGGLGLLFGIDFVARYPDASMPAAMYWTSVFALAFLVSFVMGLTHLFRGESWFFDLGEKVVAYETSSPWGKPSGVAVDLDNLDAVEVSERELGKESKIILDFGEQKETACNTRLGKATIRPVANALREHLKKTSIEFRGDVVE